MARTARKPAFNTKIYRHFAAATLLLTGAVALIASDQNEEAQAADGSGTQVDEVDRAIRKDNAARVAATQKGGSSSGWGAEPESYGPNTVNYDVYGSSTQSLMTPTSLEAIRRMRAKGPPPGMTHEEWLEYLANQEAMLLATGGSTAERARSAGSVEAMIERSRQRSGAGGGRVE